MDTAQLVLDYLRVIVWPAVALVVLFMVRGHIGSLFARMDTGEVDALGVKLRLKLREARRVVESDQKSFRPEESSGALDLVRTEFNKFFEDVDRPMGDMPQPQAAIVRAYLGLISTVNKSADLLGLAATREEANSGGGSHRVEVSRLRKAGIVDDDLAEFLDLLDDGYAALGTRPATIDKRIAKDYTEMAIEVAQSVATNTIHELARRSGASNSSPSTH